MDNVSLHQFLVLYTWFPLAAILMFLMLIARFYQKFSGVRTYFWLFGLPVVGYGTASVRYAGVEYITGDLLADVVLTASGICLLVLSLRLHRLMLSKKQ